MAHIKKVLVLAPHTDDGELGCGGTISRFCSEGKDVYYAAFSTCRKSLPPGFEPDTLEKELRAAAKILKIKAENVIVFDFDVRVFKEFRQEILDQMLKLKNQINPDMVFVPSPTDIHQDHQVISEEGLRAFKNSSILGYEMPWNNTTFNTRAFYRLEESHIQLKIEALKEYKSQTHRDYLNDTFIRSLANVRGVQIGTQYAEAFEVIRLIN
jgi:LmbE family N-acetylglucosaminyl deacetylase